MRTEFEQVVKDFDRAMRKHAARRCRDGILDPEELMQEAWIDIWRNWHFIGTANHRPALIIRMLHWTAAAMKKKAMADKRSAGTVVLEFDDNRWTVAPPQEIVVELRMVSERLDEMSPRERDVLLRRAMGDTLGEIGSTYEVSKERVRQIENVARLRLTTRRITSKS